MGNEHKNGELELWIIMEIVSDAFLYDSFPVWKTLKHSYSDLSKFLYDKQTDNKEKICFSTEGNKSISWVQVA